MPDLVETRFDIQCFPEPTGTPPVLIVCKTRPLENGGGHAYHYEIHLSDREMRGGSGELSIIDKDAMRATLYFEIIEKLGRWLAEYVGKPKLR